MHGGDSRHRCATGNRAGKDLLEPPRELSAY